MIKNDEGIYRFIGLGTKAGEIVSGEFPCEKAIKSNKAKLVLVSTDASDLTKKKFSNSASYYKVKYIEFGEKEKLGKFVGKDIRAVIVVKNDNFANRIIELIEKNTEV